MPKVTNFLTGDNYALSTSAGGWGLAAPNANGTILVTGERQKFFGVNAIKITPNNVGPVSLRITGISVPIELTRAQFRGAAWIAASDDVIAKVTIFTSTLLGSASASAETKVHGVHSNKWTLASVSQTERTIPDGQSATISMDITFHDDGNLNALSASYIYFSSPILSSFDVIYAEYGVAETYWRLPEYLRTADEEQTDPPFPLYRFMDVAFRTLSDISAIWWNTAYFPPFDIEDQKSSTLVTPNLADINTLRWLARILGVKIQNPPTGFTSWITLEQQLDTDVSGEATWTEWEVESALPSGSWATLEDLSPDTLDLESELKWQVDTAYYGINGGTYNALVAAAKRALTGSKLVTVTPRYGGDPWHIRLNTLVSQTPDVLSAGETSGSVLDFVSGTIPAGFQVSHVAVVS